MTKKPGWVPGLTRWVWTNPLHRALYCVAFGMKVHPSAVISLQVDVIDPFFVEIRAGAKIGEWAKFIGHIGDEQGFTFDDIVIQEDALIGADVLLPAGVTVGRGAMIRPCSALLTGTKVGDGEYWAGTPARPARS